MEELSTKKRVRDELAESDDSPEVKRLREDLLCSIDDSDPDVVSQDLDSVMKSFELEISASSSPPVPVVDLTLDSAESQPDLGYLLEASDDELGLPPPTATAAAGEEVKNENEGTELVRVESDSSGIHELWGLEDQIPTYDSFEIGVGENSNGEDVAYDNLFEFSDAYFESSDYSSFLWRPETLSAD
ncbi:hypothetical protein SLEP1_g51198 [Rubroshorea leprosula]|uniref:Uncharacterized protein n=1 Tax=Rubroshorea leprosula TaxID=152421 RepID=A0AAV5M4W6_9ROSI|nr:hypothetical protein SLEP1_g51198 [Rubroshorea leprosula]